MISYYKKGYYRPQFERESFIDLCGEWDFVFLGGTFLWGNS